MRRARSSWSDDMVVRDQGRLVVVGWSIADALDIRLMQGGESWPADTERHPREDVAKALDLPADAMLGFSIVSDAALAPSPVELSLAVPGGRGLRTGLLAESAELTEPY